MRTLNKTLCLVLALVMVLGMFGVATAADFTDDETIQYKEAVDVMTGIGSINGMGDGTFAPAGNVTRAQAAKMVAYAVLGADIAETLPVVASSFTDVDANFAWAIPSIEYLVKEGVINGRGDGTFDPNGNVTAYEIAKMLLVAAGYGKNGEFVGPSWALNVAIVAQREKVFAGTKATDLNAAATREECALYCFTVLTEVNMVNYDKTIDAYVPVKVKVGDDLDTTNIGKSVYGLAKSEKLTADDFGRPASVWEITGEKDPIAATAATPVAVYNDASYAKDFAAKKYDFVSTGLKILVNGNDYNTQSFTELANRKLNGTGIELYANADGEIDLIVMTQAYLATVTDYTATKGTSYGNFALDIYNPWATPKTDTATVTDTKDADLFDKMLAAGLEEDDFLLVYAKGADITTKPVTVMAFAPVTTATGALSTFTATNNLDGFNGSVTVGGTKYTIASACVENTVDPFLSNETASLSAYLTKNVTVFIDEYGMVIGVIPEVVEETVPDMVYPVKAYTETVVGSYGATTTLVKMQCVDLNGDEVIYLVGAETDGSILTAAKLFENVLCTVTTKNNTTLKADVATFKAAESDLDGKFVVDTDNTPIAATAKIIADKTYFDANTKFLFVTGTGANLKVVEATGVQATGTHKVSDIDTPDEYCYYATAVGTTGNYTVNYVIVAGAPVSAPVESEDLMFVPMPFSTDTAVAYTKADGTTGTAYKNIAFVNGAPKLDVLVTAASVQAVNDELNIQVDKTYTPAFFTFALDTTTGLYELTVVDVTAKAGVSAVTNVYGNLVTIYGFDANVDATGAFVVDVPYLADMLLKGSSDIVQIKTLADLKGATVGFTYSETSAGVKTITGIYVVKHPVA